MLKSNFVTLSSKQKVPWELMAAGMLSLSFVALLAVLLLIGWQGLSYFWPSAVYQFDLKNVDKEEVFYGQIYANQAIPSRQLKEAGIRPNNQEKTQNRLLIKIANREREPSDFIYILEQNILHTTKPTNLVVVERANQGHFYGIPAHYIENGKKLSASLNFDFINQRLEAVKEMQREVISLNKESEVLRKKQEELTEQLKGAAPSSSFAKTLIKQQKQLLKKNRLLETKWHSLQTEFIDDKLVLLDRNNQLVAISMTNILQFWYPNQMNGIEKFHHWLLEITDFVSNDPQKNSEEAGIFPAIFGTILMVFIMSVAVMPLGILAAIYLHEYAKKTTIIRLVRIAVVNLAGVPSIVYGVFGLGFFVYFLGEGIDKLFYADSLPNPTFGTPGLLWSSLTLGLLTLPVVIVSVEEGLKRIPNSMRQAALALGATQAEMLRTIVIPMVSPAIMTGLILAIARAAGEVAPLMLVGVVKLAQSLPLDAEFPFLHLDRKFMHLGYHIYDLSLRNANIEAIKPLVYATTLLLVLVVVGLNLTAIMIRNHLREKYRMLEQTF